MVIHRFAATCRNRKVRTARAGTCHRNGLGDHTPTVSKTSTVPEEFESYLGRQTTAIDSIGFNGFVAIHHRRFELCRTRLVSPGVILSFDVTGKSHGSIMTVNSIVKDIFFRCGFNIRRLDRSRLGQDPFRDMKKLTASSSQPVVFDVGANEGQTIKEFRSWFSAPVIHAFEPGEQTFERLKSTFAPTDNLYLNNVALGACTGRRDFIENSQSSMSSFLKPGSTSWGSVTGHREVEINTVDDYCDKNRIEQVDVLKSDTQGFDFEVLKGASRMLEAGRIHLVFLELILGDMYEGLPRFEEILGFLLSRGYRVVSFYETFYEGDRISWTDALFINPSYANPAPTKGGGARFES